MPITGYKAIAAPNEAQLSIQLTQQAASGWKPILMGVAPNWIVVILEHPPQA